MMKFIFYLSAKESVENSEIKKLLEESNLTFRSQKTGREQIEHFLNKLIENDLAKGWTPVLVGWNFYLPNEKSVIWNGNTAPRGKIVAMRADRPLLLQVLEILGLKPSLHENMVAYYHRCSVPELLKMNFTLELILDYAKWEMQQICGSDEKVNEICKKVEQAKVFGNLLFVDSLSRDAESLAEVLIYQKAIAENKNYAILFVFENEPFIKYWGKKEIAYQLRRKYGGICGHNLWYGKQLLPEIVQLIIQKHNK